MNTEQTAALARKIAYAIFGPASASYETIQDTLVRILGEWQDEKRAAADKKPSLVERIRNAKLGELIPVTKEDLRLIADKMSHNPNWPAPATSTPARRAAERIFDKFAAHRTGYLDLGGLNEAIYTIIDEELRKG